MRKTLEGRLAGHFNGIQELYRMYKKIDEHIGGITRDSHFSCKNGCGACCLGAAEHKEVTTFEMLPMAIDIICSNKANEYLERLNASTDCDNDVCVSYVRDNSNGEQGHCANYLYRPFVCRLFGNSLYHLRDDCYKLAGCHWLNEEFNLNENKTMMLKKLPTMSDVVMAGREINYFGNQNITGINKGLREAIEIVILKKELIDSEYNIIPTQRGKSA